jgi:hypothetical protein
MFSQRACLTSFGLAGLFSNPAKGSFMSDHELERFDFCALDPAGWRVYLTTAALPTFLRCLAQEAAVRPESSEPTTGPGWLLPREATGLTPDRVRWANSGDADSSAEHLPAADSSTLSQHDEGTSDADYLEDDDANVRVLYPEDYKRERERARRAAEAEAQRAQAPKRRAAGPTRSRDKSGAARSRNRGRRKAAR